jgi:hypothetical protein
MPRITPDRGASQVGLDRHWAITREAVPAQLCRKFQPSTPTISGRFGGCLLRLDHCQVRGSPEKSKIERRTGGGLIGAASELRRYDIEPTDDSFVGFRER